MAFTGLSEAQIRESFNIKRGPASRYILPLLVVVDFSYSCQRIIDKEIFIVEKLYEELTKSGNLADTFLILSVIHDCRNSSSQPKIVYSGRISGFDIGEFRENADECAGLTPLVNMFKTSESYLDEFIKTIDNAYPQPLRHTCPTILFITDYVDNATNRGEMKEIIDRITLEACDQQKMILEFVLTDEQARAAGVNKNKCVTFGGFRCPFDGKKIENFMKALQISSSTVNDMNNPYGDEHSAHALTAHEKNERLRKAMFSMMESLWDGSNQDDEE